MFRPTLVVILSATMLTALAVVAPQRLCEAIAVDTHAGSKTDLTPQTVEQLHALIRPQPNEWRHLEIAWLTDVVAARKKAAAEDKPLVICYTGGAGYNEPLGVC